MSNSSYRQHLDVSYTSFADERSFTRVHHPIGSVLPEHCQHGNSVLTQLTLRPSQWSHRFTPPTEVDIICEVACIDKLVTEDCTK